MNISFDPRTGNPRFFIGLLVLTLPITAGIALTFGGGLVPTALVGIVYCILVFLNPRLGLYSMVALLPFDSYFLIGGSISLTRIVGIIAFGAWIIRSASITDITIIIKQKLTVGLILLVTLSSASLLWAEFRDPVYNDLFSLVQLLILYFFVVSQVNTWKRLRTTLLILLIAVLVSIPIAYYQFYLEDVRRGGTGLSGTVNEFAIQTVIAIPILLYYFQTKKTGFLGKTLLMMGLILMLLGLAITQSRTSILILPIVLLLQFKLSGWSLSKRFLSLLAVFISLGVVLILAPRASIMERFSKDFNISSGVFSFFAQRGYLWWIALSEFRNHPFLGIGFDNFRYHYLYTYQFVYPGAEKILSYGPVHNTFFSILVHLGVFGGVIALYIIWQLITLSQTIKRRVKNDIDRSLLVGTLINCLITFLLYSLTTSSLSSKLLWLILGLTQAAALISLRTSINNRKILP